MGAISESCPSVETELAKHLDAEYEKIQQHYLLSEWDDLLVDSGRHCEAILRYLEWKSTGSYTAVDGRSKPNRKTVVNAARQNTTLAPSLRLQVLNLTETVMDFRNSRNAAHLGNIDPNNIDVMTAYRMLGWIEAEIIRLESNLPSNEIQLLIDRFAERPVPVIHKIDGTPIVLSTDIDHRDEVLVLLYDVNGPVDISTLFRWVHHTNVTRWRDNVLKNLEKDRYIKLMSGKVHLLPPGLKQAEYVLTATTP